MAAFSLTLVPLMVYNLQFAWHLAPEQFTNYENFNYLVCARWLPMEFATLIGGAILFAAPDFCSLRNSRHFLVFKQPYCK